MTKSITINPTPHREVVLHTGVLEVTLGVGQNEAATSFAHGYSEPPFFKISVSFDGGITYGPQPKGGLDIPGRKVYAYSDDTNFYITHTANTGFTPNPASTATVAYRLYTVEKTT